MSKKNCSDENTLPRVCMATLLQKANDIAVACRRDRSELEAAGLDYEKVENLTTLGLECTFVEAEWRVSERECRSETAALEEYTKECRRKRSGIARKINAALVFYSARIPDPPVPADRSRASLIQHFCDLHVYIREYGEELRRGGLDTALKDEALELMQKLADMCTRTIVNRNRPELLKRKRNRICQEIIRSISDICGFVRTVFRHDDPRLKDYRSSRSHY